MGKCALFYATEWGHTEKAAEKIKEVWGEGLDVYDLALEDIEGLENYGYGLLGISTSEGHQPPLDWRRAMAKLKTMDLSGKTLAIFGLGDQKEFPDHFADAAGILYDTVTSAGAEIVGSWWDNEYSFRRSKAYREGCFVGLILDEENQQDLSEGRIQAWVSQVKLGFGWEPDE